MIKINTSPIVHFTNEKFIGFHTATNEAVKQIHMPGFSTIAKVYEREISNLYNFINDPKASVAQSEATAAKKVRDQEFAAFRLCVKAWSEDSDLFKQKLGKAIWLYCRNATRIDHIPSKEISDKVFNLLQQIKKQISREPYASLYKGSNLEAQFAKLQTAEVQFVNASTKLQEELHYHELYSNKDMRDNCMEMFQEIMYSAKVMAEYQNNIECMEFLEKIPVLIQKYCA